MSASVLKITYVGYSVDSICPPRVNKMRYQNGRGKLRVLELCVYGHLRVYEGALMGAMDSVCTMRIVQRPNRGHRTLLATHP